jgi:hypothetical protein
MDWGLGRTQPPHRHTGTYVNGFSISVKTQLHPGDTITFGTGPTCVPCHSLHLGFAVTSLCPLLESPQCCLAYCDV